MGRTGYCREHILDAGLNVLLYKGYNGTGVKEIVDAAGVPKGSFYNHFTSKEAFVVEAIEKVAQEGYEQQKQMLTDPSVSPTQRLVNFFSGGCDQVSEDEYHGGCLIGNLCQEMADENEAIRETTVNIMNRQVDLITDCIEEAKSANEVSKDADSAQLAEFLFCAWEGAVMRAKGTRTCNAFTAFSAQMLQLLKTA